MNVNFPKPKVSVIIPTIGRESLRDTIESVLNQTYKNLEIIITDDTEERKAFQLVSPYLEKDNRIRYIVNTKYRHGPAGNKNNGLDNITGEYFTFCDDDDTLLPDAIETLVNIAIENGYKIVFGNCVDQYNRFTGKHYGKDQEVDYKALLCGDFEGEYFGIVESSILENDGFIDDCWGGEGILWLKLWKKAQKGFYVHKILRNYRLEGEDRVTKRAVLPNIASRQVLTYVHYIDLFFDDYKKYCPKNIIRYSTSGITFVNLSGEKRKIIWFLTKSFEVSKLYTFLFVIPWAIFCLLMPKKIVSFVWEHRSIRNLIKLVLLGRKRES